MDNFYKCPRNSDGKSTVCKTCRKETSLKYRRKANAERDGFFNMIIGGVINE
jgi:hypothetical protein